MTLTELLEQIRISMPVEFTNVSDAMLTKMLNQIYQEVGDAYQWPWLDGSATLNTVASTQSYAVPAGVEHIVAIFETADDNRALRQQAPAWYWTRYGGDDTEAEDADFFFLQDDKIWFYPVPSTSTTAKYTIKYYGAVTELSAGSDEPAFAEGFHYMLVHGVVARLYMRGGQSSLATQAYSMYYDYLERLRKYYNRRNAATPMIWGDGNRVRRWTDPNLPILDGG